MTRRGCQPSGEGSVARRRETGAASRGVGARRSYDRPLVLRTVAFESLVLACGLADPGQPSCEAGGLLSA